MARSTEPFTDLTSLTEYVGASACWGPLAPATDAPEILLRLGVRDHDKQKIEAFSKMVPAVILSGPPGVAVTGGRPQAQEVVAYWPALVPRDLVRPALVTAAGERTLDWPTPLEPAQEPAAIDLPPWPEAPGEPGDEAEVALSELAHGRSGDKGDMANIGIIARSPEIYPWLVATLTAARVQEYFAGICLGEVERHEVPNLAVEALTGILMCGWSTGFFFAIVSRMHGSRQAKTPDSGLPQTSPPRKPARRGHSEGKGNA